MKRILYFLLCAALLTGWGCSGKYTRLKKSEPVDPPEMHVWFPPAADELEKRRLMQGYLDGIERDIVKLFLSHEESLLMEENLRAGISSVPPKIDRMEGNLSPQITDEARRGDKMETELASVKSSIGQAEAQIEKMKEVRVIIPFSKKDYFSAIRLFRDGNYKKSVTRFKTTLKQNPPRSIADNIHFGLGASYYKLNRHPEAVKQFNQVVEKFPEGDKWFISNLMLGFIHNLNGDKSKAIYVLDRALRENPPDSVRGLIDRLLEVIEEGGFDASS
ncbi:MAG: tetratricopeptide repeat protein [Nitrospinaceae bacterium]